jgi:hypothetical protein
MSFQNRGRIVRSLFEKKYSQFIQNREALVHITNLTPFAANILKGLPHNLIITLPKDLKQDGSETDRVIYDRRIELNDNLKGILVQ